MIALSGDGDLAPGSDQSARNAKCMGIPKDIARVMFSVFNVAAVVSTSHFPLRFDSHVGSGSRPCSPTWSHATVFRLTASPRKRNAVPATASGESMMRAK
jgi:hypothetical protein